jgi:Lrp/AsnC family transcriptional regulator, leucine-responsive regulatory protein
MDIFDRKLLVLVQRDNRMTNEQLGRHVGLSPAACHRRLKRLAADGVIERNVSLVSPAAVGRHVTLIVHVTLEREQADLFDAFKDCMRDAPEVTQCYYVTGTTDFVLILNARNMQDYEAFTRRHFYDNPNIQRFQTDVVMDTVKFTTEMPIASPDEP